MITYYVAPDGYRPDDITLLNEAFARSNAAIGDMSEKERESVAAAILHAFMCGEIRCEELVRIAMNAHAALRGPMRSARRGPRG